MKRFLSNFLVVVLAAVSAVSCFNDDDMDTGVNIVTTGVYVLNSGMMNSNNSTLTILSESSVATNAFMNANAGKRMGDSANDMIRYGSKLYIAVTGSAVVFVTDMNGKIVKEITLEGESANLCPRQIASGNGNIFVTYKEGYVAAIDTASFNVTKAKVGPSPEGVVFVEGKQKLYVAITNGYNYPDLYNKVQILDAYSLETIGELEVAYNPQTFHVYDENTIYLVSWGDYGANPAALQKINPKTDEVVTIDGVMPTNMTIGRYRSYLLCSEYDENWNQKISYYVYNNQTDTIEGELISSDLVPNGYCIFADDVSEVVYIGTSDYVNNGDIYVVRPPIWSSTEPSIITKYDAGGINPIKICFKRNFEN